MADSKEAQFQQDIIAALATQGWRVGSAGGYFSSPDTCSYLIADFSATTGCRRYVRQQS